MENFQKLNFKLNFQDTKERNNSLFLGQNKNNLKLNSKIIMNNDSILLKPFQKINNNHSRFSHVSIEKKRRDSDSSLKKYPFKSKRVSEKKIPKYHFEGGNLNSSISNKIINISNDANRSGSICGLNNQPLISKVNPVKLKIRSNKNVRNLEKTKSTVHSKLPLNLIEERRQSLKIENLGFKSKKILGRRLIKNICQVLNIKEKTLEIYNENKNEIRRISKNFTIKNDFNTTPKNRRKRKSISLYLKKVSNNKFWESDPNPYFNKGKTHVINSITSQVKERKVNPQEQIQENENQFKAKKLKKFKLIIEKEEFTSEKEDEIFMNIPPSQFMIDHEGKFRKSWDLLMLVFVIYSIIVIPLNLAFDGQSLVFKITEIIIEISMIIDIFLNFLTSYTDEVETLIVISHEIINHYVSNWLLLDLICAFPSRIINILFPSKILLGKSSNFRLSINFIQWFNILRFTKLAKDQLTGRIFYSIVLNQNMSLNRTLKFVLIFIVTIHITSCLFLYISNINVNQVNWVVKSNLTELGGFNLYIASLYYNVVTIYTVGYGDITPSNITEIIYISIFLFIGSQLFSYAISSLSQIFSRTNQLYTAFKRKKLTLKSIHKEFDLPHNLLHNIKVNLQNEFRKNQVERFEFLESLPSNIKNEIIMIIYKKSIKSQSYFKNQSHDFVLFVLPLLKTHRAYKGDVLISVGEFIEEMYLIVKGLHGLNLGEYYDRIEVGLIRENQHFGDLFMQTNGQSPYELRCKSKYSDLLVLKKGDYLKVKYSFLENTQNILEDSFQNLVKFDQRRNLILKLFKYSNSSQYVKDKIQKLNIFLMKKGFEEFYNNDVDFEDAHDFLNKHNDEEILQLLDNIEKIDSPHEIETENDTYSKIKESSHAVEVKNETSFSRKENQTGTRNNGNIDTLSKSNFNQLLLFVDGEGSNTLKTEKSKKSKTYVSDDEEKKKNFFENQIMKETLVPNIDKKIISSDDSDAKYNQLITKKSSKNKKDSQCIIETKKSKKSTNLLIKKCQSNFKIKKKLFNDSDQNNEPQSEPEFTKKVRRKQSENLKKCGFYSGLKEIIGTNKEWESELENITNPLKKRTKNFQKAFELFTKNLDTNNSEILKRENLLNQKTMNLLNQAGKQKQKFRSSIVENKTTIMETINNMKISVRKSKFCSSSKKMSNKDLKIDNITQFSITPIEIKIAKNKNDKNKNQIFYFFQTSFNKLVIERANQINIQTSKGAEIELNRKQIGINECQLEKLLQFLSKPLKKMISFEIQELKNSNLKDGNEPMIDFKNIKTIMNDSFSAKNSDISKNELDINVKLEKIMNMLKNQKDHKNNINHINININHAPRNLNMSNNQ